LALGEANVAAAEKFGAKSASKVRFVKATVTGATKRQSAELDEPAGA
jgi:hypothetical protein